MPDHPAAAEAAAAWPRPRFYFEVKWDDAVLHFHEISGLDVDLLPVAYRSGHSRPFSPLPLSGLKKFSDVTMRKGIFKSDSKFWDWFHEVQRSVVSRKTVTVSLLDENGSPTMVWTLANAWPTRVSGVDLQAQRNEVAVEQVVFAHEGLAIGKG